MNTDGRRNAAQGHRAHACFRHPATWAAIALLAANDHVLKSAWPSVLTGKLSDFAGLFFFPFLLAALLAPLGTLLAARRSTVARTDRLGPTAFTLTALWFTAVKTTPAANAVTVALIEAVPGIGPVRIALDPTDLVALVALWPAWRLWRGAGRATSRQPPHPRRLPCWARQVTGTAALVAAALATMATSMAPETEVTSLTVDGAHVYTGYAYQSGAGWTCSGQLSQDGGHTWNPFSSDWQGISPTTCAQPIPCGQITPPAPTVPIVPTLPAGVCERMAAARDAPAVACVPGQPDVCYRAAPIGQVEATSDGGRTWTLAWGLPQHRIDYIERVAAARRPMLLGLGTLIRSGPNGFDPGPFDIVVIPEDNGHRVVVAMGKEGVVVRDPDGTWTRAAVADAQPTDARAASILEALAVSDAAYWMVLVLAIGLGWALARRSGRRGRGWAWLFTIGGIWLCLALNLPIVSVPLLIAYPYLAPATVLLVGLAVLYWALLLRWRGDSDSARSSASAWFPRAAAGAFFLAAWLPFPLWAFGVIPGHDLAVVVAVLGGGLAAAWGWRAA